MADPADDHENGFVEYLRHKLGLNKPGTPSDAAQEKKRQMDQAINDMSEGKPARGVNTDTGTRVNRRIDDAIDEGIKQGSKSRGDY